jgi:hypothetical protein
MPEFARILLGCQRSTLDVEAAIGDTSKIDVIWVPGEGSSIGNATGGRKFARHHLCVDHHATPRHCEIWSAPTLGSVRSLQLVDAGRPPPLADADPMLRRLGPRSSFSR